MVKNKPRNIIRLAKFLAQAGVASRRKSEELILAGVVKIGDQIVRNVATNVLANQNNITVKDRPIILSEKVYYLLNKPVGYICSLSDPHNDKKVIDLVPQYPRVFPVGRLDKDSSGLILLTNDGDLTQNIMHPSFGVKKNYLVDLDKPVDKDIIGRLKAGVRLEEGLAKADNVKIVGKNKLEIIIHQGWKRQIRRMLKELGYQVKSLVRVSEGKLRLNRLPVGQYRKLKKEDIL